MTVATFTSCTSLDFLIWKVGVTTAVVFHGTSERIKELVSVKHCHSAQCHRVCWEGALSVTVTEAPPLPDFKGNEVAHFWKGWW